MIPKKLTIAALALLLTSTSAFADDIATQKQLAALQQQIKQLQEQLNLLQRKQEVAEEITAGNNQKFATVEFSNKGLNIQSPDKQYALKIKGYVQADTRKYIDDASNNGDTSLIRGARPTFDLKLPNGFSARLTTDFGGTSVKLVDAYTDWKARDELTLRAGKFKAPLGLEKWQSDTEGLFIERGLPANFTTSRDIGFGAYGELVPAVLEYQLALTDGGAEGADITGDTSGGKDFTGRIFAQPFKNSDIPALQGVGIGFAGSVGQRDGTTTNTELTTGYKTTGQNNFFTYSTGTFGNGKATKINPQAWYYNGPLSVLAEYLSSEVDVRNGATNGSLKHDAYSTVLTYVLTGEDAAFDGVKPSADFSLDKGTWGAFELAGRIGALDIDDAAFGTFASIATSATSVDEKVFGLNWYLSQNLKIQLDYAHNSFEGGAAGGLDRPDEKVVLARVQFKF